MSMHFACRQVANGFAKAFEIRQIVNSIAISEMVLQEITAGISELLVKKYFNMKGITSWKKES